MRHRHPDPIDVHVGGRLRTLRMMMGFSQEKLGDHLGITFQQIQKYESGKNRISASRLLEATRLLKVPVAYFFEDASGDASAATEGNTDQTTAVVDFLATKDGVRFNKAFGRIKDAKLRHHLIDLLRALASDDGKGDPTTNIAAGA
jgi:transcriptional regulator with XRE-family HTH domain